EPGDALLRLVGLRGTLPRVMPAVPDTHHDVVRRRRVLLLVEAHLSSIGGSGLGNLAFWEVGLHIISGHVVSRFWPRLAQVEDKPLLLGFQLGYRVLERLDL